MKVNLKNNRGWSWFSAKGISVKGYVCLDSGECLEGLQLVNHLGEIDTFKKFRDMIRGLNGSFALIIDRPDESWIAVDRVASFPLYITATEITDEPSSEGEFILDDQSVPFFIHGACCPNRSTLDKRTKQLYGGEIARVGSRGVDYDFYYHHDHIVDGADRLEEHYDALMTMTKGVAERLIESAGGRTLVIPLSGGYDSRYVAAMLKKAGYEKVVCFTYGRNSGYEAQVASAVCEKLGYPWHFINYDEDMFRAYFTEDGLAYRKFACHLSSVPQEQEYFALKYLKERDLLPHDAIIVPGFSADLLAGSYLPDRFLLKRFPPTMDGLVSYILFKHFPLALDDELHSIRNNLHTYFGDVELSNRDEWNSCYEKWFTLHKVSRFVINGVRAYEFFGFEWRMPLWDQAMMDYWYRIPHHLRHDRKLYRSFLDKKLFAPLKIDMQVRHPDQVFSHGGMLSRVRWITPKWARKILKSMVIRGMYRDVNRLEVIGEMIRMHEPALQKLPDSYLLNHIQAAWIVESMKNKD